MSLSLLLEDFCSPWISVVIKDFSNCCLHSVTIDIHIEIQRVEGKMTCFSPFTPTHSDFSEFRLLLSVQIPIFVCNKKTKKYDRNIRLSGSAFPLRALLPVGVSEG